MKLYIDIKNDISIFSILYRVITNASYNRRQTDHATEKCVAIGYRRNRLHCKKRFRLTIHCIRQK